jgi:DNA invertase Pin-like site-specific DNA recombinase
MTAKKGVAYYRVSTELQARFGCSLDAQKQAVHRYIEDERMELVSEYKEVESAYRSGKLTLQRRPRLARAIGDCKKYKAQLVIAALDRLARNVVFIAKLVETRLNFVALDMPNATPFMIHIYAAVAEEESRQKGRVIKAALALAKVMGKRWDQEGQRKKAQAQAWAEKLRPVIDEIRAAGDWGTYRVAKALNCRGVLPFGDTPWTTQAARRLLGRLGYYASPLYPLVTQGHIDARRRFATLWPEIAAMRVAGLKAAAIADRLNEQGSHTAQGRLWTDQAIWSGMKRYRRHAELSA